MEYRNTKNNNKKKQNSSVNKQELDTFRDLNFNLYEKTF